MVVRFIFLIHDLPPPSVSSTELQLDGARALAQGRRGWAGARATRARTHDTSDRSRAIRERTPEAERGNAVSVSERASSSTANIQCSPRNGHMRYTI